MVRKKSGIGLAVFELSGSTRKRLFEYKTTPHHYDDGMRVLNTKFGLDLKIHSEKMIKRMRY